MHTHTHTHIHTQRRVQVVLSLEFCSMMNAVALALESLASYNTGSSHFFFTLILSCHCSILSLLLLLHSVCATGTGHTTGFDVRFFLLPTHTHTHTHTHMQTHGNSHFIHSLSWWKQVDFCRSPELNHNSHVDVPLCVRSHCN